ncbi:MAG: hypothetical protein ACR2RE_11755, partial [Geminicoccaceae bacterium]
LQLFRSRPADKKKLAFEATLALLPSGLNRCISCRPDRHHQKRYNLRKSRARKITKKPAEWLGLGNANSS